MRKAMTQVRIALGPDALIRDGGRTETGVAITAGIKPEPALPLPWPHRELVAFHNAPGTISLQLERCHNKLGKARPIKLPPQQRDISGARTPQLKAAAASADLAQSLEAVFQLDPFSKADANFLRSIYDISEGTIALVPPAGLDPAESADLPGAFRLGATHPIPARLDFTRRLGGVLAAITAGSYIITEAGIGPGAADGMASLTPALLAQYLYRPHASLTAFESSNP